MIGMSSATAGKSSQHRFSPEMLFLLLFFLAFPCSSTFADIFHLSDGKVIEGTVIREVGDLISIRDQSGNIVTIDKSLIVKTEIKKTSLDEYLTKAKALQANDQKGHRDLALWCTKTDLQAQAQKHWKIVITLDPDNNEARQTLGYIWLGGDWFIQGSKEALQRQKQLTDDTSAQVKEIPEQLRLPEWDREDLPELPELPPVDQKGFDTVVVVVDEKIGRQKPERSGLVYHLRRMGGKIKFVSDKEEDAQIVVKVRTRCYFVRLQTFFGAPVSNIFQGEAKAQFFQRNAEGKLILRKTTNIKTPFSSSANRPKDQALSYTYYKTLEAIAARVSRWGWMKERGSKSLVIPDDNL
ncbi:MAG: hypothetical protein AAEJ04_04430 [Planctomycetota bacterium]